MVLTDQSVHYNDYGDAMGAPPAAHPCIWGRGRSTYVSLQFPQSPESNGAELKDSSRVG